MATSVHEVLVFHQMDRATYEKVCSLSRFQSVARNVTALWMWLELIGINVMGYLRDCRNNTLIERFATEAEAILSCLRQDANPPADSSAAIPLTDSLVVEPLNLRFFYFNRDLVLRGLSHFLDGVGRLIFDDDLIASFRAYENLVRSAEDEARRLGVIGHFIKPRMPSKLAMPYQSRLITAPEDRRSMFIAFLKDQPLSREDIIQYFTERWGTCIQTVMLERTSPGILPMYGRIVLTSESYVELVLNGENPVKFVVNGRQIWASAHRGLTRVNV